jgi:hypothetical protein
MGIERLVQCGEIKLAGADRSPIRRWISPGRSVWARSMMMRGTVAVSNPS